MPIQRMTVDELVCVCVCVCFLGLRSWWK